MRKDVFESLTALARQRFPQTKFTPSAQFEGPLWQLVTQRPAHLLDPHYDSWEAALLGSLDRALASLQEECKELRRCTWGEGNVLHMRHPLSSSLPFASRWLDMPAQPLPGDAQMPRVQGGSIRRVAATGRVAGSRSAGFAADAGRPGRSSAVTVLRCGPRGVGARRADAAPAGRREAHADAAPNC